MKAVTLAFFADGTASLVTGPEVKPSEQNKALREMKKSGAYPEGAVRLEIWPSGYALNFAAVPKSPAAPAAQEEESPNESTKGNVRSRARRGG